MKNLIYIFCLSFLFSCSNKESGAASSTSENNETSITLTEAQLKNAGIVSASPGKRSMSPVLKVNGKIDVPPQNMVSVSVPLGGYLKSTHLLAGTKVKKGEVLAVVEDQGYIQLQQDFLTAKLISFILRKNI